jgi:methionyl aminopeptidase
MRSNAHETPHEGRGVVDGAKSPAAAVPAAGANPGPGAGAKIGKLSASEVRGATDAADRVVETHRRLASYLRHGMTLAEIDMHVAKTLADLGAKSCFLGYRQPGMPPFPSHACLSVNECVVHGTAGYYTKPLGPGDVLKIDIGVTYKGWIGDAAWTYLFAPVKPEVQRLADCGKESLRRGVRTLRPPNTYLAWAQAVQTHVEKECGFHLIRGLGGHGYGRRLHEAPFVSNVVPSYLGEWSDAATRCVPGTLIAVEPMIAIGTGQKTEDAKKWPVYSADGSMSVHYEHDVLITEADPMVLTKGLEELPDVVEK